MALGFYHAHQYRKQDWRAGSGVGGYRSSPVIVT